MIKIASQIKQMLSRYKVLQNKLKRSV